MRWLVFVLLLIALGARLVSPPAPHYETYPYVQAEYAGGSPRGGDAVPPLGKCTGQNEWVLQGSKEIPIRFDAAASNATALRALEALAPGLRNAKIMLKGQLLGNHFRLRHWYLRGPFEKWETRAPDYDGPIHVDRKPYLDFQDFRADANVDPLLYRQPEEEGDLKSLTK